MRSLILTAATEEHHQDSTSGQRERYQDVGLGVTGFFAEQLEETTTRPQFDPLQLDDSSHQGA
jgi:hypothetical protein